jgi:hypothetical protein
MYGSFEFTNFYFVLDVLLTFETDAYYADTLLYEYLTCYLASP